MKGDANGRRKIKQKKLETGRKNEMESIEDLQQRPSFYPGSEAIFGSERAKGGLSSLAQAATSTEQYTLSNETRWEPHYFILLG